MNTKKNSNEQCFKARTQFNPNYKGTETDIKFSESLTVPDETLTIKELLLHHTRGNYVHINQKQGEYFDTEIPDIQDLTDLTDYRNFVQDQIKEHEEHQEMLKQKQIELQAQEKLLKQQQNQNNQNNTSNES